MVGYFPIIFKRTKREEMNNMNEKINELIEYPKKGILSKDIVKNNILNVTLFCMAKGTEISGHTSTKQGFVYVIEGDGIFNLEGEEITMSSGVFIYMKENAIHSLKANENTSFILVLTNT
jgi:nitric oxide dioxygenase